MRKMCLCLQCLLASEEHEEDTFLRSVAQYNKILIFIYVIMIVCKTNDATVQFNSGYQLAATRAIQSNKIYISFHLCGIIDGFWSEPKRADTLTVSLELKPLSNLDGKSLRAHIGIDSEVAEQVFYFICESTKKAWITKMKIEHVVVEYTVIVFYCINWKIWSNPRVED